MSIKNRYNHTVINPDATFANNLDNIIPGLTKSFEKYYNLKQKNFNEFEIPNYVRANDGKYYKYNYAINNTYYCPNNIIIENFRPKRLPKEKYILMDYFILDLQDKKIYAYDYRIDDGFDASINSNLSSIDKLVVKNIKEGKEVLISNFGKKIKIILDKDNNITGINSDDLKIINSRFLWYNNKLTTLIAPNLKK